MELWAGNTSKRYPPELKERAVRMFEELRGEHESEWAVAHTDRRSRYTAIRYTKRLAEANIAASVGSVGLSYDNALAESINGLFKTDLIKPRAPWRTPDAVEIATAE